MANAGLGRLSGDPIDGHGCLPSTLQG